MAILNDQFNGLVKVTLEKKQALMDKNDTQLEVVGVSPKNPDFFRDNKPSSNKPERQYTTTKIKSRNFLSSISYVGINKEDFYN